MSEYSLQNIPQVKRLALKSDLHLARKLWHMGTGLFGLYLFSVSQTPVIVWAYLTLSIALVGFALDFFRLRVPALNRLFVKLGGTFMRESERSGPSGLPFYALGVSLTLFIFPEKIALLAILFLVFADPICSFFGIKYGTEKILANKSLEGSLAGFCTCYLLSLFYGLSHGATSMDLLYFSILGGVIGTLSELFSVYVDDNLTIPLVSGLGLWLINGFFGIL